MRDRWAITYSSISDPTTHTSIPQPSANLVRPLLEVLRTHRIRCQYCPIAVRSSYFINGSALANCSGSGMRLKTLVRENR